MNLFMLRSLKKIQIVLVTSFLYLTLNRTNAATPDYSGQATGDSNWTGGTGDFTGRTGPAEIPNPLGVKSFVEAISRILDYLIYISVPILALMILWGGFQILIAREAPEKISNGRKTIMYAVIGFVIILASKGIALIFIEVLK